jgi:pectin methylesterase-like acyl-CoA thioesterase
MKNKFLLFLCVFFLCWFYSVNAQTAGDYRSLTSGYWNIPSTWQTYDGLTWNTAIVAPALTSGTITIQFGHTITDTTAVTINSGVSVVVNGYLKVSIYGFTATTTVPYSFTFNNGSTYEHAINGGTIPMAAWGDGSLCLITGTAGTAPSLAVSNSTPISYYNYTWNCPNQSASINTAWDSVTVRGDLTCTATGISGGTNYWRLTSAATTRTITINGNLYINGGNLTVSGSSGACQYNTTVNGNIVVSSNSKFSLCAGSGGFGTLYLKGDLTFSGTSTFVLPSNKTVGTILFFAKNGGTQNYTYTSSGVNQNMNYGVMNNATVQLNAPITPYGSSTANIGHLVLTSGRFVTTATNIITLNAFDSVYTGSGYIDGPLAATIASTSSTGLRFPLGKGGVYRPVILTITQDAATSTVYTGELIGLSITNTLPFALDAVASARYFHFVKGTGANVSSATIQLSYDTNDGVDVSNKDNIRIAKDDGAGTWINFGGSGTANNTGNILSNSFGTSTSLQTLTTNDFIIAHLNPVSVATIPTLSTNGITFISTTFATSGGVISNDGNAAITAKGVCWNTLGSPTLSDAFINDGTTSAPFTSSITGLTAGTIYHVRAYATNSAGTAYGNDTTFTTLSTLSAPVVITNPVTNIVNTTASGNASIIAWGGSPISDRGICFSLSHNPTMSNDYNSVGAGGTGAFTAPIGGLLLGNTYYVRAYATNSTGTTYADEVSFATPTAQPDVVKIVAQDGSGNYTNLYDAFNDVPTGYTGHWYIYVKNGTYYDKVTLAAGKINVVLVGQNRDSTIFTFDDYAGNNRTTHGVLSNGTNTSYSVAIDAADFQAQNVTFRNTSNAYAPGVSSAQAVALRNNGDRQSFYNCKMLGYQDTYYTQGGLTGPDRLYNKHCYVEGAVDFIFGRDVVLFDSCTIFCNRQGGTLTAGATEVGYSYGYVFLNSTIGSTPAGTKGIDSVAMTSFYLGRPWQTSPKTVFINCYEPTTVNAAGWTTMGPNPSLYSEYGCYGPGSVVSRPVIWAGTSQPSLIADTTAAKYTIANIFSKNNAGSGFTYAANWIPSLIPIDTTLFSIILPVEMTSFTAKLNVSSVNIKWTTATEVNNNGFEIEKKITASENTASDWKTIASIKGNGNSNSPKDYSFDDKNIFATGKYSYRLKQIDKNGNFKYSKEIAVDINIPVEFKLNQNYPNPFNPTTTISFSLPIAVQVSLKLYDVLGKELSSLVNEEKPAGNYNVEFNASKLSSGLYIYQLRAGNFVQSRKMILMK